jgi:hypothetical protein
MPITLEIGRQQPAARLSAQIPWPCRECKVYIVYSSLVADFSCMSCA